MVCDLSSKKRYVNHLKDVMKTPYHKLNRGSYVIRVEENEKAFCLKELNKDTNSGVEMLDSIYDMTNVITVDYPVCNETVTCNG